jgi:hypothetical protein
MFLRRTAGTVVIQMALSSSGQPGSVPFPGSSDQGVCRSSYHFSGCSGKRHGVGDIVVIQQGYNLGKILLEPVPTHAVIPALSCLVPPRVTIMRQLVTLPRLVVFLLSSQVGMHYLQACWAMAF